MCPHPVNILSGNRNVACFYQIYIFLQLKYKLSIVETFFSLHSQINEQYLLAHVVYEVYQKHVFYQILLGLAKQHFFHINSKRDVFVDKAHYQSHLT